MVVAWQRSQCLIELADEQMAAGVDAVPPSVAATSLGPVVLPHTAAYYGTTGEVLLSHECTRLYTIPLSPLVGDSSSDRCVKEASVS